MRKRKVIMALAGILICGNLVACGGENKAETKGEGTKVEDAVNEKENKKDEKPKNEILKMKMGEPVVIKENDKPIYEFTINKVEMTKERNQFSDVDAKQVFFIEYSYKNIADEEDLFISGMNFKVLDGEGEILDTYPVSRKHSKSIPIGAKCTADEAYATTKTTDKIKIMFYDNMFDKALGEMEVNLK